MIAAFFPDLPPRFSMVIPAYNEAARLPAMHDSACIARERYRGGANAIEVIIADNASTDATVEIARDRGCTVATVEKRAIAAARNGGAQLARGEFLCFVDADSRIHPETFNAIDAALAAGRFVAGATGVHPERWSVGIAAMAKSLWWAMFSRKSIDRFARNHWYEDR